ncbi:hypothetical protein D3C85_1280260 [compost metagenome]
MLGPLLPQEGLCELISQPGSLEYKLSEPERRKKLIIQGGVQHTRDIGEASLPQHHVMQHGRLTSPIPGTYSRAECEVCQTSS